jgi:hypothetical protein
MRQNPYGSRTFDNPQGDRICMANSDPRHSGLFGAAWTIGYATRIAAGAAALYVPAGVAGPRGVISPRNTQEQGQVTPLFHAVRLLAGLAGAEIVPCAASSSSVALLAAGNRQGVTIIAANLSDRPIRIAPPRIAGGDFEFVDVLGAVGYDPAAREWAFRRDSLRDDVMVVDAFAVALFGG